MEVERRSYSIDQFADPEAEVERLRRQARLAIAAERSTLEAMGLRAGMRVLDVGCGPGFSLAALAETIQPLEAIGVDIDPWLVRRGRAARGSLRLAAADALALPLREGRFDFAYFRLVLRHLASPEDALREALRVTRPGGRVCAADTDDGGLLLDPVPEGFEALLRARQETSSSGGGDHFAGRKLFGRMQRAGLDDIRVRPLIITSTDVGLKQFHDVAVGFLPDSVAPGLLPVNEVERARQALRDWSERPDSFGSGLVFFASGQRSA